MKQNAPQKANVLRVERESQMTRHRMSGVEGNSDGIVRVVISIGFKHERNGVTTTNGARPQREHAHALG